MNFYKIFFLMFLFAVSSPAQRLMKMTATIDGRDKTISFISRRGSDYVSAKEIASVLSGAHFYNEKTSKLEIKFRDKKIKFTARNQFVILSNRSGNNPKVFQLPISTLLIKNDVFVPLNYCSKYLSEAAGIALEYNSGTKHLLASKTGNGFSQPENITEKVYDPAVIGNYDVYAIEIEEKFNGTQVILKSNKKIYKQSRFFAQNKLMVTLSDVSIAPGIIEAAVPAGLVKKIEKNPLSPNTIQLEFTLNRGFSSADSFIDEETNDLVVAIHSTKLKPKTTDLPDEIAKWNFDAIVIDAGHGGKDPGAIGVSGIREKDVNLSIALKLGKLIEKNLPGVKIIYTRRSDEFVELFKRGKIANENNGKLFISIHCNSLRKKPSATRGFETYLLRPGRTEEAIKIAEFENSVIEYEDDRQKYKELTDENFILVSMAHSAYMRYSEKFSDLLNQHMSKLNSLQSRGIKQAGFYVLVGASMPGILFESGFLSNRSDEAYLKSSSGQAAIAGKIFEAVKNYKNYYEKIIKEET